MGRVCKLKKSIYGLKQAPRCWYQKLADVLEEMGFRTSSCDESLFLKGEGEKLVLFLVYVDDILLFSSSMKEIQKVQQQLMKNFKCKTLGEVKYYLGMHVERDLDHRWLKLHQEKFTKELGEKYGIENERKVATPLPAEFKLVKAAEDEGVEAEDQQQFQTSSCDESLFLKGEGEKLVLFLVYVDDILLFSSSMKEIQKVQQQLMKNFKCKTLGEVKYYLGMHVERDLDHRWLKLHQEKFIKELGEKYGIENERKVATPLPAEFKLVKAAEDEGVEAEELQQFQSLVGSLLYAAVHTRPDISFSVGQLARVVQNPSEEQVDAAESVVKYLNSHPSIGVQYSASAQVKQKGVEVLKEKGELLGEGKLFLTCFTDATWASEKDDSSSVGGYICVVGGGPVSWRFKKQTATALSSCDGAPCSVPGDLQAKIAAQFTQVRASVSLLQLRLHKG
ncbi:unnamed protein product [Closterium sp. NIES-54]